MEEVPVVSSSDAAWTHLFKSLKLLPEFSNVELRVTDDDIIVMCKNPDQLEGLKKHLTENLAIPERLMQNARTQLHVASENGEIAATQATSIYHVQYRDQPPAPPQQGDGVTIFKNVFGEEFSLSCGDSVFGKISVQWNVLFEERPGMTVLLSKNPVEGMTEMICAKWAEEVSKKASQIPLFNLRRLYRGQPLLVSEDESLVFHTAEEALIKRCFGFVQKGNDKYFYCDYDLLYKILFSPQIVEQKETEERPAILSLNKKHFIAYLRQIFSEGVFMELLENKADAAHPVLLPSPTSQAAPTVVVLMLDVSGSMAPTQAAYAENVLALVRELAKRCTGENDQLIIVPFSAQEKLSIQRYSFSEIDKISQNPDWLKCDGSTRLFGSMNDVLTSSEIQGTDPRHHNLNLILVTDGRDNIQTAENKEKLEKSIENKSIVKPQMFTVGFGKEYDAKLCAELTTITGGHHQELKSIEDLAAIKHIDEVVRPRTLVEFKKAVVDTIQSQFVSVYDQPVKLNETIRAGDKFSINGRQMSFVEQEVVVDQMDVEDMSPKTLKKSGFERVAAGVGGLMQAFGNWTRTPSAPRTYGKPVLMQPPEGNGASAVAPKGLSGKQ